MRVLGVDLGGRRIGLALSDPEERFAFPLDALESAGAAKDVEAIRALIGEREVERIVVGLPLHMDGGVGPQAEAARGFARRLSEATGLPVELLDERWTTAEAERDLQASESRRGKRKRARKSGARDSMAASIILRTWLERARSSDGETGP